MPHTLQELAEFTAARLIGDGNIEVTKVASIAQAQPGDLVFVQDEKDLQAAALASQSQRRNRWRVCQCLSRRQAAADRR